MKTLLVTVSTAVFVLTACGSSNEPAPPNPTASPKPSARNPTRLDLPDLVLQRSDVSSELESTDARYQSESAYLAQFDKPNPHGSAFGLIHITSSVLLGPGIIPSEATVREQAEEGAANLGGTLVGVEEIPEGRGLGDRSALFMAAYEAIPVDNRTYYGYLVVNDVSAFIFAGQGTFLDSEGTVLGEVGEDEETLRQVLLLMQIQEDRLVRWYAQ